MKQIAYFTAGTLATVDEKAAIAKLNAIAVPAYQVTVMSAIQSPNYGAGPFPADFKAGSPPAAYDAVPTIDPDAPPTPDNLPATQAVVNNAQKITGVTGSGTVANIAVNPTTKAVTITLTAS